MGWLLGAVQCGQAARWAFLPGWDTCRALVGGRLVVLMMGVDDGVVDVVVDVVEEV